MEDLTPEKVIEQITLKVNEAVKGLATSETADDLKSELDSLKNENTKGELDSVKTVIAGLEGKIEALKERPVVAEKSLSLGAKIVAAFNGATEQVSKIAAKELNNINLAIKADTMTLTTNYTGQVGLSELEQGVTRIVRRRPFLRALINVSSVVSKFVVYVEQKNPDPNSAGMVAEGALKPQSDFDLEETSKEVRKIATFIKVSREMLSDLSFMAGEINSELIELIQLKLDEQILLGDGIGQNLEGIDVNAVAWAAGSFAGTIPRANESDVLRVAIAQIAQANFLANGITLNPADAAKLQLTKATNGEYTYPVYQPAADGTIIVNGVPIIENNLVPVGTFYVGDWTRSNLRIREDINIQIGYVNDDFTRNLVTILAEMRAVHYVKSNHYGAFVKGTFAPAIAALTPPPGPPVL
jgi:HK97 family phage major capsid protein